MSKGLYFHVDSLAKIAETSFELNLEVTKNHFFLLLREQVGTVRRRERLGKAIKHTTSEQDRGQVWLSTALQPTTKAAAQPGPRHTGSELRAGIYSAVSVGRHQHSPARGR